MTHELVDGLRAYVIPPVAAVHHRTRHCIVVGAVHSSTRRIISARSTTRGHAEHTEFTLNYGAPCARLRVRSRPQGTRGPTKRRHHTTTKLSLPTHMFVLQQTQGQRQHARVTTYHHKVGPQNGTNHTAHRRGHVVGVVSEAARVGCAWAAMSAPADSGVPDEHKAAVCIAPARMW